MRGWKVRVIVLVLSMCCVLHEHIALDVRDDSVDVVDYIVTIMDTIIVMYVMM